METGNPKQVALLSVMAVGAVGFLFTRVGGKHAESPRAASAVQRAATAPAAVALTLIHDPFSHPHLAVKTATAPAQEAEPMAAKSISPLKGSLPPLIALNPDSMGKGEFATAVLPPAGSLAKKSPAPPKASTPSLKTIGLEAIAGASATVAFLSVDGAESRPFGPQDVVFPSVRVLSVEDGQVVLVGPHGKLTLGVGEKKSL